MAQRERQAADPIWDGICFHAQQCAEKYMKAFLEEQTIVFHKTHDLVGLMDLRRWTACRIESLAITVSSSQHVWYRYTLSWRASGPTRCGRSAENSGRDAHRRTHEVWIAITGRGSPRRFNRSFALLCGAAQSHLRGHPSWRPFRGLSPNSFYLIFFSVAVNNPYRHVFSGLFPLSESSPSSLLQAFLTKSDHGRFVHLLTFSGKLLCSP
jgi:hypothetical protein